MPEPKRIEVTRCWDPANLWRCPFGRRAGDGTVYCGHEDAPRRYGDEMVYPYKAPDWCPLLERPVLVVLKPEVT